MQRFSLAPLNASLSADFLSSARSLNGFSSVKLPSNTGFNFPLFDDVKPNAERFEVSSVSPNDPPVVSAPSFVGSTSSGRAVSEAVVNPQTVNYVNAELAKAYGLSASTAYQEALSNTSYQRAVKDMKSAGLNPAVLFGAGRGSPANSVVYANENTSPGSFSYRGYGKSSAKSQLFSSSMYSALSAIGGLVGIALTGKPDGFWIGSQTTQGAMGLLNAASSAAKNK